MTGSSMKEIKELQKDIYYTDKVFDDEYEYRQVHLPRQMLSLLPAELLDPSSRPGRQKPRLLSQDEAREIGICQSDGWIHFGLHAPEPHILLFKRRKQ